MGYEQLLGEIKQQQTQIGEAKKTHEKETGRYKTQRETWLESQRKAKKEITTLEDKIEALKKERYKQTAKQQIYTSRNIKDLYRQLSGYRGQLGKYKSEGIKGFAEGKKELDTYKEKIEKAEAEIGDYKKKIKKYQEEGYTPKKTDDGWSFSKQVVSYKTVKTGGGGGGGTPIVSQRVKWISKEGVPKSVLTQNVRIPAVTQSIISKGGHSIEYESLAAPESKHYKYTYKQVPVKTTVTKTESTVPAQVQFLDKIGFDVDKYLAKKGLTRDVFTPEYKSFKQQWIADNLAHLTDEKKAEFGDKTILRAYNIALTPMDEIDKTQLRTALSFKKTLTKSHYDTISSQIKPEATYKVPQPSGKVYTFKGSELKSDYDKKRSEQLASLEKASQDVGQFYGEFYKAKESEPALYLTYDKGELGYEEDIPKWYTEYSAKQHPLRGALGQVHFRLGNVDLTVKSLRGELPGKTPAEVEKSIGLERQKWTYEMAKKKSPVSKMLHMPSVRNVAIPLTIGVVTKPVMAYAAYKGTTLATTGKTIAGRTLGRGIFYSPYVIGGGFMGAAGGQLAVTARQEQLGNLPGGTTATAVGELGLQITGVGAGAKAKWITSSVKTTKTSTMKVSPKDILISTKPTGRFAGFKQSFGKAKLRVKGYVKGYTDPKTTYLGGKHGMIVEDVTVGRPGARSTAVDVTPKVSKVSKISSSIKYAFKGKKYPTVSKVGRGVYVEQTTPTQKIHTKMFPQTKGGTVQYRPKGWGEDVMAFKGEKIVTEVRVPKPTGTITDTPHMRSNWIKIASKRTGRVQPIIREGKLQASGFKKPSLTEAQKYDTIEFITRGKPATTSFKAKPFKQSTTNILLESKGIPSTAKGWQNVKPNIKTGTTWIKTSKGWSKIDVTKSAYDRTWIDSGYRWRNMGQAKLPKASTSEYFLKPGRTIGADYPLQEPIKGFAKGMYEGEPLPKSTKLTKQGFFKALDRVSGKYRKKIYLGDDYIVSGGKKTSTKFKFPKVEPEVKTTPGVEVKVGKGTVAIAKTKTTPKYEGWTPEPSKPMTRAEQQMLMQLETMESGITTSKQWEGKISVPIKKPFVSTGKDITPIIVTGSRLKREQISESKLQPVSVSVSKFEQEMEQKQYTTPLIKPVSGVKSGTLTSNIVGVESTVRQDVDVGQISASIQGLKQRQAQMQRQKQKLDILLLSSTGGRPVSKSQFIDVPEIKDEEFFEEPPTPPPPIIKKTGGDFVSKKVKSYKPKKTRKKPMKTLSFSKGMLAEPFRAQRSQVKFGKATHPKVTSKLVDVAFKTGFKVPTVELVKEKKRKKSKKKKKDKWNWSMRK